MAKKGKDEILTKIWGGQINAVMEEISRNSLLCGVKLLDPGVMERVVRNDESVCAKRNSIAFRKLRDVLMLGFVTQEKSFDKLGPVEADALIAAMREQLKERFGGNLGG